MTATNEKRIIRTELSYADCERIQHATKNNNLVAEKTFATLQTLDIKRGQIYICDLGDGLGSEQKGVRPVLIIQNDVGNHYSSTVLVVPITSATKKSIPTHMKIRKGVAGLSKDSTLMVEQMRTIDKSRLRNCIGEFTDTMMSVVNQKIMVQVGIGV